MSAFFIYPADGSFVSLHHLAHALPLSAKREVGPISQLPVERYAAAAARQSRDYRAEISTVWLHQRIRRILMNATRLLTQLDHVRFANHAITA